MLLRPHPSANFGARRAGAQPDMIVLHYTGMDTACAALARLCDPAFDVSCHYVVDALGQVYQLVDDAQRAWHAGQGSWGAVTDVNSHSIGIELCNPGPLSNCPPFPAAQMSALSQLLGQLMHQHRIPAERVVGHSDIAPARKADPGPRFDWRQLALAGQSVWAAGAPGSVSDPQDADASWTRFQRAARRFGYGRTVAPDRLLSAFRLRFAPQRLGQPMAGLDISQIEALAAAYPCIDVASSNA